MGAFPDLDATALPEELLARAGAVERVHEALSALVSHHQRLLDKHCFLEQPLRRMASAEATSDCDCEEIAWGLAAGR